MSMMMLSCSEVTQLVTDYLEGRMPFWKRVKFRMHIGLCRPCKNYIHQMEQAIETLGHLPDEPIPPDVEDALVRHFRNWKG